MRWRRHGGPGAWLRGGSGRSGEGARIKRREGGDGDGGGTVVCWGAWGGGGSGGRGIRLPLGLVVLGWLRGWVAGGLDVEVFDSLASGGDRGEGAVDSWAGGGSGLGLGLGLRGAWALAAELGYEGGLSGGGGGLLLSTSAHHVGARTPGPTLGLWSPHRKLG